MTRNTWTTVVALVVMLPVTQALAARGDVDAGNTGRLISLTSQTSPGETDTMYTVPARSRLVVTQACIEHVAMQVAMGGNVLTYNGEGCTAFAPGLMVAGGQTLTCGNTSGLARTCVVVGVLEDVPPAKSPRVRFYDLQ